MGARYVVVTGGGRRIAWLLSLDARGVTGQAIDQNGGAWVG